MHVAVLADCVPVPGDMCFPDLRVDEVQREMVFLGETVLQVPSLCFPYLDLLESLTHFLTLSQVWQRRDLGPEE